MVEILLDATVRAGTPILFATLGAIINERAGIINLGIEGLMLIGALGGFAGTYLTGSLLTGVMAAFLCAFVAGAIHGFITVQLRGNQIVSGLALTMFGIGMTALFGKGMVGMTIEGFERIAIPGLSLLPVIGKPFFNQDWLIYFSFALVALIWLFFYRTRWGLAVRTLGENPAAADTCGVPVNLYRFLAVTIGSGIVGIGGAYLSLATTPMWIENMSAGRGWIAVALVIFASWSSPRALLGAYLFGGITAMQLRFQAMGTSVSAHILQMLPYFFTIVVLVVSTIRLQKGASQQPESLGLSYDREDRK
ncbi:nucleoside ABC transporter membrane protein [Malonomonas rubra DSM 5091]|uniref:Nucleoside ABC transporter membrane protein n=1 Tax=Malonomonas rubra DSM 5091 TaxID=1122189 RepID=A0A1M6F7T1_MALRU|nr:ABC transporter permease [Malonomonas rubra]SHI93740.1 nucleoside ABC transporter membrane protein [Malonomonas rubra DSM 5091]